MKYIWLIFLILIIVFLNRSYARFYKYLDSYPLVAPPEAQINPSSEKPKFVSLGDSLFAGLGSSGGDKSLGVLVHKGLDPKGETDLINLAVSGATVNDVLMRQLPSALEKNPQVVSLLIGVNDVHDFTTPAQFERDYRKIIDELQSKTSAKIILINIPYLGSSEILLPPWNLYMNSKTKEFNKIIDKIAGEKGLKVVDLYATKDKFIEPSDLYSRDQFHPSDKGYMLWAKVIVNSQNINGN